jgi:hypothetical protein
VPDDERIILDKIFDSPYFFSASVIKESPPVILELEKIYRQQDEKFLDLLNKIRNNIMSVTDLDQMNRYYNPDFNPKSSDNYITLSTHHYKADTINRQELDKLPGKTYHFKAIVEGTINESAAPADNDLVLKKDAQIMFIKNDRGERKRYYNGKIGVIAEIDHEEIGISFPDEEGILFIEREEWKNIRYSYDKATQQINEKVLGTFQQFPIRLAWAITIHKSQGLTFNKAIIDAGDSFTSGQVYVALSRLRSLDGLVLKTPIRAEKIYTDRIIREVLKAPGKKQLKEDLNNQKLKYITSLLLKSMDWESLVNLLNEFIEDYKDKEVPYNEEAVYLGKKLLKKVEQMKNVAGKFKTELVRILDGGPEKYGILNERMKAAFDYFNSNVKNNIQKELDEHYNLMEKRPRIRKYLTTLLEIKKATGIKIQEIKQASDLAEGLAEGKNITGILNRTLDNRKKQEEIIQKIPGPLKVKKGDSRKMSLEMFRNGKTIGEIASERMLTTGTIESHLSYFVREGKLDVFELIPRKKYDIIVKKIKNSSFDSISELKFMLGDHYSWNEIRTVLNHLNFIHSDQQS